MQGWIFSVAYQWTQSSLPFSSSLADLTLYGGSKAREGYELAWIVKVLSKLLPEVPVNTAR